VRGVRPHHLSLRGSRAVNTPQHHRVINTFGVEVHGVLPVRVQIAGVFQPAKGKKAMGAATPMFSPIIPTSTPL
jgi:hypothetical protein